MGAWRGTVLCSVGPRDTGETFFRLSFFLRSSLAKMICAYFNQEASENRSLPFRDFATTTKVFFY